MRIDGWSGWLSVGASEGQSAAPKVESSDTQAQLADCGDTASISSDGSLAQILMQRLAALPDIRNEKVAQLRQAVQTGTYQVSSQQIAQAMTAELRRSMAQ